MIFPVVFFLGFNSPFLSDVLNITSSTLDLLFIETFFLDIDVVVIVFFEDIAPLVSFSLLDADSGNGIP